MRPTLPLAVTAVAGLLGAASAQSGSCADLNGDSNVDVSDLLLCLSAYGQSAIGDVNADGTTDVADLLLLLSQYGSSCVAGTAGGVGGATIIESRATIDNAAYDILDLNYFTEMLINNNMHGAPQPPRAHAFAHAR